MSHQNEPPPAFHAPPKSCDAHFHIFGPAERYPYGSATTENLRYAPPLAPLSDYLELAKLLGVEPFMQEQIELAKSNLADQLAAIDAASGAIPIVEKKCRKPTRRYPSF